MSPITEADPTGYYSYWQGFVPWAVSFAVAILALLASIVALLFAIWRKL